MQACNVSAYRLRFEANNARLSAGVMLHCEDTEVRRLLAYVQHGLPAGSKWSKWTMTIHQRIRDRSCLDNIDRSCLDCYLTQGDICSLSASASVFLGNVMTPSEDGCIDCTLVGR